MLKILLKHKIVDTVNNVNIVFASLIDEYIYSKVRSSGFNAPGAI